jgi:hypothetical protein
MGDHHRRELLGCAPHTAMLVEDRPLAEPIGPNVDRWHRVVSVHLFDYCRTDT